MAAVIVQGGLDAIMSGLVAGIGQQFAELRLYQNDLTPSVTDTLGSYTEANFAGYSAISLISGDWGSPSGGSQPRTRVSDTFSFVFAGPGSSGVVYGYYITAAGALVAAERGAGVPYSMDTDGDQIDVTLTLTSENA